VETELFKAGSVHSITSSILDLYREHDALKAKQIAEMLDIDRRTVTTRLRTLMQNGMIRWTRHGYRKTDAFISYLEGGARAAQV
jgi:DNA-binding MarR family transcriptional regulator